MSAPKPPVLHRAALERVLLRAAELQATGADADAAETLTEADLHAIAAEVGITPQAVRQALLEERMRVVLPREQGLLATLAGPATFVAMRTLAGAPGDVLATIDADLQAEENLTERRRFPNRLVWGPRGGFAGTIRTLTRLDGRGFPLARADEVSATVMAADGGHSQVRIEATLHTRRGNAAKGGVFALAGGIILAGLLNVLTVALPLALASGALIAGSAGWLARKNYQRDARFTQLAIEQTLDRLEFGAPKKRALFSGL